MLTRVTRVTRERQRGARGEFIAQRPHQPATNILRRRKRFIFRYGLSFSGESHFFLLLSHLNHLQGVGICGASLCHEKALNDFLVKRSRPRFGAERGVRDWKKNLETQERHKRHRKRNKRPQKGFIDPRKA